MLPAFCKKILLDGNKESFGRTVALPFLLCALLGLVAATVVNLVRGEGVIEEAATLATIGFSLFTSSKYLSIKGQKIQIDSQPGAPTEPQV